MLTSPGEDVIVSAIGWADKNALHLLETRTGSASQVQLSDARYLSLHAGCNGHFAVQHHRDGGTFEVTAHAFANPATVLARITFTAASGAQQFEGDAAVWRNLPQAYVAFLKRPGNQEFHLVLVEPVRPAVEVVALDWYGETYDKGYQGVTGVVEVPNRDLLIVSVQRDSHPVLVDRNTRKMVGKLSLANNAGNPVLRFRRCADELWADDYDTLLRLDPADWRVRNRKRLQGAMTGSREFIGAYAFTADETLCAVARPFSGDVVALDTRRFKVTHTCHLGRQPLLVSVLSDGTVWARDWKTGDVLRGALKRKWFAF